MKSFPVYGLCLLLSLLGGCSTLSATNGALTETQETMRMLRQQVKLDRRVLVTLVGGHSLNPGTRGVARPVLVCIYLSTMASWSRAADVAEGSCVAREKDTSLLVSERRILAPDQLMQLSFPAPGGRDSWVVVDADFGDAGLDYRPLRTQVENQEQVQINAWLDNKHISSGNAPQQQGAKQ